MVKHKKCEHGIQKHKCKKCGGKGICEHGRQRYQCKDCGGKGVCEHYKHRPKCPICRPDNYYKRYQKNARERGFSFSLSRENFFSIIGEPCFYCGEQEQPRGIDRFSNSVGYTIENSRACCGVCNKMKLIHSVEMFTEHVQRIADHTRERELTELQESSPWV